MITEKEKLLRRNESDPNSQRFELELKVTGEHPITGEIVKQKCRAVLDDLNLQEFKKNIEGTPFEIINIKKSNEKQNYYFVSVELNLSEDEKKVAEKLIWEINQNLYWKASNEGDGPNYEGYTIEPVPDDFLDNVKIYYEVCLCHPQSAPKIKYICEIEDIKENNIDIWDATYYFESFRDPEIFLQHFKTHQ
ncbi:hypothetical protein YDYSY3_38350 [Paenibacillus chitinolyticus]|uniref:hypothetical protein n=1 Tax=Paenibacillus chitinolyticus TaxID=79263 RepID=UPI0026E4B1AC|nr:hypothetical protein [Paenibacillus chitinolyticus]GKS12835.1 hypothetical protein YDYSY3_38350 [Paenibacillus chitinolyticus]